MYGFELPNIGTMTRYEWFRFLAAHTPVICTS
jgi:hypothetical protein